MNKSEIAEKAAREEELFKAKELAVLKNDEVKQLREFLRELRTDILCGTGLRTMTDVELKAVRSVERAIAESQAPQPIICERCGGWFWHQDTFTEHYAKEKLMAYDRDEVRKLEREIEATGDNRFKRLDLSSPPDTLYDLCFRCERTRAEHDFNSPTACALFEEPHPTQQPVKKFEEQSRDLGNERTCSEGNAFLDGYRTCRERAIAESQAPQPTHRHEWTGSQWDDQMYCECGAIKLEDGSIKCMGDGEPSPPLTEAKELFELYLGVSKSSDVNTYVDWYKRVNDWLKRNSGAAQEVSPPTNMNIGFHKLAKQEVSPPSPEQCEDCKWHQCVPTQCGCSCHKSISTGGDTRELKAALEQEKSTPNCTLPSQQFYRE